MHVHQDTAFPPLWHAVNLTLNTSFVSRQLATSLQQILTSVGGTEQGGGFQKCWAGFCHVGSLKIQNPLMRRAVGCRFWSLLHSQTCLWGLLRLHIVVMMCVFQVSMWETFVDVHFFTIFQYCILLAYTYTDYPLSFIEENRFVGKV